MCDDEFLYNAIFFCKDLNKIYTCRIVRDINPGAQAGTWIADICESEADYWAFDLGIRNVVPSITNEARGSLTFCVLWVGVGAEIESAF